MLSRPNTALSQIHLQIMWSRLIAVVEEQAQTLVRTAFSTTVREAGDLSAGVFDRDGNMLAQAITGTPGHVNSMAAAVKHFLDAFPLATMKAGDHYITNDPWLTCGHLHDLTVVSPTFLRGEPVGLFASTVHVVDIGGLGMGPDGRQVFEEGLSIPLMPLARQGEMNEDLLRILRANVREPLQVEGDVYALAACNDEGSRRLVEMMDEFGIANLDRLGEHIIETSRAATIEAIGKLTPGKYKNSVTMDGYDRPLTLMAEMTIAPEGIHVDYTGTSPASAFGINVVMNYTLAYTAFGVKCLVAPEVPNNAGSLAPITASAPDGCLLNVKRPRAVAARHTVGHMLPDTVFGCLHQVMASGVPAEGASSLWNPQIYGGADVLDELGEAEHEEVAAFSTVIFHCGGTGARPGKDVRPACARSRSRRPSRLPRSCSAAASSAKARAAPGATAAGSVKSSSWAAPTACRSRCCAISSASTTRRAVATAAVMGHRAGSPGFPASRSAQKAARASRAAISSVSNCRAAAALAIPRRATPTRSPPMLPTG